MTEQDSRGESERVWVIECFTSNLWDSVLAMVGAESESNNQHQHSLCMAVSGSLAGLHKRLGERGCDTDTTHLPPIMNANQFTLRRDTSMALTTLIGRLFRCPFEVTRCSLRLPPSSPWPLSPLIREDCDLRLLRQQTCGPHHLFRRYASECSACGCDRHSSEKSRVGSVWGVP